MVSGDVIMMFLFLAMFMRALMYFLSRFCVGVWWLVGKEDLYKA